MPIPDRPSLLIRLLDPTLLVGRQEVERDPAAARPAPVPAEEPSSSSAEARSGPEFKAIVRANLHAAARHVLRNHRGPSFRECSRPSCRNASDLLPYPVVVEEGATDAELEVAFQRVVTAALEEVAADPASIQMGWEGPAFIS